ncbi:MAG: hypothetical protein KF701_04410 [Anaerolineales bacterium]|nr:MAG: hypothetical protein KF701_04410 [Anaerolineales bacterium]
MSAETAVRGMYFEDFEVGQKLATAGRTVTETDIVMFAGLTGDFNQIHVDAEYSKTTPFGARVAHGLLGLSFASGLIVQTGIMSGTIMAFREITEWKFIKPIFIGDTVHVETDVLATKALPRIGGGSINLQVELKNQTGETLMKGVWTALFLSRPS